MTDSTRHEFTVAADEAGTRLDRLCAARIDDLSRNQVQQLNEAGQVTLNGAVRNDRFAVSEGDVVVVNVPVAADVAVSAPEPQQIPINIVYEDDHLVVVNKQVDLVVHPAHGNWDGTLVNALLGAGVKLAGLGGPTRPGIVHRLDKDTSGLIVVAKTDAAYASLSQQLKERTFSKRYHAFSLGNLGNEFRRINEPIGRHPVHRQRMAVTRGGREAITEVNVVDRFSDLDYIRLATFTGRTHQIRVHLAHVAHPLLGDPVYGGRKRKGFATPKGRAQFEQLLKLMPRHALHASEVSFDHPGERRRVTFRSPLPPDMRGVLETLYREHRFKEV